MSGAGSNPVVFDPGPHQVAIPGLLRPVHRIALRMPHGAARADVRWIACSAVDLNALTGPPRWLLVNCVGRFRCRGVACPITRGSYVMDLNAGDRLVDAEAIYTPKTTCLTRSRCYTSDLPPQAATIECLIPYYDGPFSCRPASAPTARFDGAALRPAGVWLGRSALCRRRSPYSRLLGGLLARCASDESSHPPRGRRPRRSGGPGSAKPDIADELR
jgi:hypothetical protein